jgi:hypothetical protein
MTDALAISAGTQHPTNARAGRAVASLHGLRQRVQHGWLGSFMQFGYRIVGDMSHISLLLSEEARALSLRVFMSSINTA